MYVLDYASSKPHAVASLSGMYQIWQCLGGDGFFLAWRFWLGLVSKHYHVKRKKCFPPSADEIERWRTNWYPTSGGHEWLSHRQDKKCGRLHGISFIMSSQEECRASERGLRCCQRRHLPSEIVRSRNCEQVTDYEILFDKVWWCSHVVLQVGENFLNRILFDYQHRSIVPSADLSLSMKSSPPA